MWKTKWKKYHRQHIIPEKEREFVVYMLDMVEEDALRFRLSNLILWYIDKAEKYKRDYYILNFITMASNLMILIANAAGGTTVAQTVNYDPKLLTTALAAVASCALGLNSLGHCKDNWMRYRKSAEDLKESLSVYVIKMKECQIRNKGEDITCGRQCGTYDYGGYQCPLIKELMEQVSEYVSKENDEWKKVMGQKAEEVKEI